MNAGWRMKSSSTPSVSKRSNRSMTSADHVRPHLGKGVVETRANSPLRCVRHEFLIRLTEQIFRVVLPDAPDVVGNGAVVVGIHPHRWEELEAYLVAEFREDRDGPAVRVDEPPQVLGRQIVLATLWKIVGLSENVASLVALAARISYAPREGVEPGVHVGIDDPLLEYSLLSRES